eukprot:396697-Prorocentrum_lima.AAC.1
MLRCTGWNPKALAWDRHPSYRVAEHPNGDTWHFIRHEQNIKIFTDHAMDWTRLAPMLLRDDK